jgi:hypothetical protein
MGEVQIPCFLSIISYKLKENIFSETKRQNMAWIFMEKSGNTTDYRALEIGRPFAMMLSESCTFVGEVTENHTCRMNCPVLLAEIMLILWSALTIPDSHPRDISMKSFNQILYDKKSWIWKESQRIKNVETLWQAHKQKSFIEDLYKDMRVIQEKGVIREGNC